MSFSNSCVGSCNDSIHNYQDEIVLSEDNSADGNKKCMIGEISKVNSTENIQD